MLDRFFGLIEAGTTVRVEILAGITTFLTMAYIIVVNPSILAVAGMDKDAVFVATCLAAAFSCFIMGLYANYPIALAPGMGLNAFLAFGMVKGMGMSWETALGAIFCSSVLTVALSLSPARAWIFNGIPRALKFGIAGGIGLFLAIIGLKNAGLVVDHPATLITLGDVKQPAVVLAALGFMVMVALEARKFPGAIIVAILGVTALGVGLGLTQFQGIVSAPPSIAPTFLKLDIWGALQFGVISTILVLMFVDLFDTAGTLVGVSQRAGLLTQDGKLPRLKKALVADSSASLIGSLLGTSNTTSYIESAAGVEAGGRTGLVAVVVGLLFLAALVFAPLANTVPAYATAPALVLVACYMAKGLVDLDWGDITEYAPGMIAAMAMPFTFSIAHGIAFGFIAYAAIKTLAGRAAEVSGAVWTIAILFVLKFAFL
ncbi:MAG: NCS2 family permease [Magnetospirillum sp.]|nr:NCS2 family permease [Magnetospirillum sp.]